jgi:hypothetical protein
MKGRGTLWPKIPVTKFQTRRSRGVNVTIDSELTSECSEFGYNNAIFM